MQVINNPKKLHFYTENNKSVPSLKLIMCDQNGKRWDKEMKEKYEYISKDFCKKMSDKYNESKKMTTGLCTILYYLYNLKHKNVIITNFDLEHKM